MSEEVVASEQSLANALRDPKGYVLGGRRAALRELPKCTIVVLGKTGVGKSTLVNAVFGVELAKTGVGSPVTTHLMEHTVEDVPVTILDTRGIELKDELDELLGEFDDLIGKRLREPPERQLHVLWYCVASEGGRFEPEVEERIIRHLSATVPALLVLTRTLDPDDDETRALVSFIQSRDLPVKGIVPVLALERKAGSFVLPEHGLDALVALTAQHIPEGQRRAFLNSQIVELDGKLEDAFAHVDAAAGELDTSYQPLAFARGLLGRAGTGETALAAGLLNLVGEVSVIYGRSALPDEVVADMVTAVVGEGEGESVLVEVARLAGRAAALAPPVPPITGAKVAARLLAAATAAEAENRKDLAARRRRALLTVLVGRAVARTFHGAALEELEGRSASVSELRVRFNEHFTAESAAASEG